MISESIPTEWQACVSANLIWWRENLVASFKKSIRGKIDCWKGLPNKLEVGTKHLGSLVRSKSWVVYSDHWIKANHPRVHDLLFLHTGRHDLVCDPKHKADLSSQGRGLSIWEGGDIWRGIPSHIQVQWVEQFGIQREVTQYPWQVVELTLGLQIQFWSLTPATISNESKTWKSHSFVCYLSSNLLHFSSTKFSLCLLWCIWWAPDSNRAVRVLQTNMHCLLAHHLDQQHRSVLFCTQDSI